MGKSSSWISITQAITNLAVVIGLVVVVYELQQNRALMQLQMTSDHFALAAGTFSSGMGEEFPEVYARACTSPHDVSHSDAVVLLNYYQALWSQFERLRRADSYELSARRRQGASFIRRLCGTGSRRSLLMRPTSHSRKQARIDALD